MNAAADSPGSRVTPNALHAFGGIWRLTVSRFLAPMHWAVLAGLIAVLLVFSIPFFPAGLPRGPYAFVRWVGDFYLMFLVPIMAFISAAGAMRDEMKPGTVDFVFTRPVRRPVFVLGRYLSHLACAQVDFLCALGALAAFAAYRQIPGFAAALPLLFLAQVLMVTSFSAFGFLCGILSSRYIVIGFFYGVVVELGIGQIPTEIDRISMTRLGRGLIEPLMGRLAAPNQPPPQGPVATTALLLAASAFMLAVAAMIFARRELAAAPNRET
jgi:ABC-type transport system involved in multi-copper enzyme maturation permease subunit